MQFLYVVMHTDDTDSQTVCDLMRTKLTTTGFPGCWGIITEDIDEDTASTLLKDISFTIQHFIDNTGYSHVVFGWNTEAKNTLNTILSKLCLNDYEVKTITMSELTNLLENKQL